MNFEEIEKLAALLAKHNLGEITVEDHQKTKITVKAAALAPAAPVVHHAAPAPVAAKPAAPAVEAGKAIKSPLVGTFYKSPSPDAAAYVKVGDTVKPDTTLCILEAMKVMNEVKAEVSGVITEILCDNGQPVEYDQPLFRYRPL